MKIALTVFTLMLCAIQCKKEELPAPPPSNPGVLSDSSRTIKLYSDTLGKDSLGRWIIAR